jgi:hypothetical protein
MILNNTAELTWKQFTEQPQYKNLTLNEQVIAYNKYLEYISNLRNSMINYQNKGPRRKTPETPGVPLACVEGMDVVFLIDYTGSMGDYIDGVKLGVLSIINTIVSRSNGNYRLGLVLFDEYQGDVIGKYGTDIEYTSLPAAQRYTNYNATADRKQFITAMEAMSNANNSSFTTQLNLLNDTLPLGAGFGGPEPGGIGFQQILNGIAGDFRPNVARLVVLITDAQPGGDDDLYTGTDVTFLQGLAATALNQNIQLLLLTRRNTAPNTEYRILSDNTNGSYTRDTDLSVQGIINSINSICDSN